MTTSPETQRASRKCPRCGGALPREVDLSSGKLTCPDCGATFKVSRAPKPAEFKPQIDEEWLNLATQGDLFTPTPEYAPPPPPDNRLPSRELLKVEVDEPTTWLPLWVGVFSFPWHTASLPAWIGCTMSLAVGGGLTAVTTWFAIWVFANGLSMAAMSLVSLIVATSVMVAISFGYVTSALLTTIEATGNGYDVIEEWGSNDFKDWPPTLIPIGFALAYAGGLAYVFYSGSEGLWLAGGVGIVALPVVLLSMLELDSWLIPLSSTILRTLRLVWWAWLIVWIESIAMWGLVAIAFAWLLQQSIIYPVALAPLIAAAVLIYGRMLGRLAWLGSKAVARENERMAAEQ